MEKCTANPLDDNILHHVSVSDQKMQVRISSRWMSFVPALQRLSAPREHIYGTRTNLKIKRREELRTGLIT